MDMKRDFSIRDYREGDEEGIFDLWQAVLPSEQRKRADWMRWWHWMYKENPAGDGLIWLAEANGHIVAQHALIPVRYKVGNKVILGSWGMDAMTHMDYRRQGIFETISTKLLDHANRIGIDIETGFPNQFSFPGLTNKLGWCKVASTSIALIPFNWENTIRMKVSNRVISKITGFGASILYKVYYKNHRVSRSDGLTKTNISRFDDRFDTLWSRVSSQFPIMLVRDKDYLNWRYKIPGTQYVIITAEKADEVQGYLILKNDILGESKVSLIFDMIAETEEVMHHLVSEAVRVSKQGGYDFILSSFVADNTYHRVLKKDGFLFLPILKGANFCVYSNSKQVNGVTINDPKNWLVQAADSDAI
jgi:hypothetical protein